MSDSVRPHRRQPTRLPCPWDSPGKNTGVGCHFLLQCVKVKSEREVAQSFLTLSDPMDCSLPGSSVHGIFQTRVLESMQIYFLSHCDYLCFSFSTLPAPLPSPPHRTVWGFLPEWVPWSPSWYGAVCLWFDAWLVVSAVLFLVSISLRSHIKSGLDYVPPPFFKSLFLYCCINIKGESCKNTVNYKQSHVSGH